MRKVMTRRGRLSYSAYSQTPADGKRYEFRGGEVYVSPAPPFAHQFTSRELFVQLERYFDAPHGMAQLFFAPLAVIFHDTPPADGEIVVPDLLVVADQSTIAPRGVNGAPLVAVELISPSNGSLDRKVKFERYAANGVAHYWMLDPIAETMECYRLVEGQYVLDAVGIADEKLDVPAFAGLTIDLRTLWLRLDPSKS